MGDNMLHSRDSRLYGPVPLALVKGKAILCVPSNVWPWVGAHRLGGLKPSLEDHDQD